MVIKYLFKNEASLLKASSGRWNIAKNSYTTEKKNFFYFLKTSP